MTQEMSSSAPGFFSKPEAELKLRHSCGCICIWTAVNPMNAFVLHGLALKTLPCPWHGGESGECADIAVRQLGFTNVAFADMLTVELHFYKSEG